MFLGCRKRAVHTEESRHSGLDAITAPNVRLFGAPEASPVSAYSIFVFLLFPQPLPLPFPFTLLALPSSVHIRLYAFAHVQVVFSLRFSMGNLYVLMFSSFSAHPALCDMHPMRALFLIPRNPPPRLKSKTWWVSLIHVTLVLSFFFYSSGYITVLVGALLEILVDYAPSVNDCKHKICVITQRLAL